MRTDPETGEPLRRPSAPARFVHLAALWAIAVVQPLLNLLGKNPDFFVARDDTGFQIVMFAILLTVLPPVAAGLVESLVGRINDRAGWILHLLLVAGLFTLIGMQFLKGFLDGPTALVVLLAACVGAGLTWAYVTRRFIRSLIDLLVIAPPVILAAFLFFSDSSTLITSQTEAEARTVTVGRPAPVVMIVFDELPAGSLMTPAGRINSRRFPNFAELEKTGTWYRNTTSNAAYTAISVPSLLTGTPPDRHALPTAAAHPDSIFTLLGNSYRVRAIEPITQICPESICGSSAFSDRRSLLPALGSLTRDLTWVSAHLLLPASAGPGLPDISESFQDFGGKSSTTSERGPARQWARDRLDRGEASLDGEAALESYLDQPDRTGKRTLDLLHLEEPHIPWNHFPAGYSYSRADDDFRNFFDEKTWFAGRYMTERAAQAHLLETGFADTLLGRVIDRLKAEGRWDETLFVVTSDHGGSLRPGLPRRPASAETAGTIGMVPLFIKRPGQQRGRTVTRPTCSTGIVPEIARILQVPLGWKAGECDRKRLQIDNGTGPIITVPFARAVRQRDRYVQTLASLFGGDTGWDSVLRLGPGRDLIGQPLDSLRVDRPTGGESARPDGAVDVWRPKARFNPVLRSRGTLGNVEPGRPLLVAVNGVIAATGESYSELGRVKYSMLLPQWALRPGSNRIGVYAVNGRSLIRLSGS